MAEPKDTTSFFRKVVKFVANPATEWDALATSPATTRCESDYAKGELKAMIERKRRNDFVCKREFDMLRKVRREGLSGEQLAALLGRIVADRRLAAAHLGPAGAPGCRRQGEDRRDRAADGRRRLRPTRSGAPPSSTMRRPSRHRSTSRRRPPRPPVRAGPCLPPRVEPVRHGATSPAAPAPAPAPQPRREPPRWRRSTSRCRRPRISARPFRPATPKSPTIPTSTRR